MQQQNKKRYIVFDPDDIPEEMVLRINNEMTKTCEQLEAEAVAKAKEAEANYKAAIVAGDKSFQKKEWQALPAKQPESKTPSIYRYFAWLFKTSR